MEEATVKMDMKCWALWIYWNILALEQNLYQHFAISL